MIEKIQLDGSTLMDITTRQWHQCPEKVREYLNNVTYDPSDYSNSEVSEYVETPVRDSRPIGHTVNGVTHYNEVPNVATPIVSGAVKPLDYLRWLNTTTINVRDLGGWACDGGTVKYGKLIRGGECVASDKSLMVDTIGIKHELSLRGKAEAPQQYSLWCIDFTCPTNYVWMSITDKTTWKGIIRCVFDNVTHEKPLYFHCAAGADRTGTVAVMLEALLGMSQSDIDKDYELTNFYTGTGTAAAARLRNEDEYKNYIAAIKAVPLEGGLSDSFRNRAVSFVLSLGFTIAEINAFRTAMINGNPTAITVSMDSYTVTKSGSNITFDNNISSIDEFQGYEVNLSANSGYAISNVSITMGGTDVTSLYYQGNNKVNLNRSVSSTLNYCTSDNNRIYVIDGQSFAMNLTADSGYTLEGGTVTIIMGGVDVSTYYSDGKIAIPQVTGNLVITATAVPSAPTYTNQIPLSVTGVGSTTIYNDGLGYKNGYRYNSSNNEVENSGAFITGYIKVNGGDTIYLSDNVIAGGSGGYNTAMYNSSGDTKHMMTPYNFYHQQSMTLVEPYSYDLTSHVLHSFTVPSDIGTGGYIKFTGSSSTGENAIITVNEPIS